MRRPIAAAALAVATALAVLPSVAAEASTSPTAHGGARVPVDTVLPGTSAPQARAALARAQRVLTGAVTPAAPASGDVRGRVEGTLAMRDLFAALPDLGGSDRRQARAVLARPTDGPDDPYGDGYRTKAKRRCAGHICVHWVTSTSDKASKRSVTRTLRTMNAVWRLEVDKLGYRKPVRDGHHGGNNLLDVYLKDVGANYLYGYCAPEYLKPHHKREASGYCVLDNDFARSQFGARPIDSLRVTAAHEFFHAVQFAYDYEEDSWLMEATATWMEERYADGINDNRQYLRYGQVKRPASPLDYFNSSGYNQYGNWPFFEYLSSHYGLGIVRQIWRKAAEAPDGSGGRYSTQAVSAALSGHRGFPKVFARYAAANLTPGLYYAEGSHWPHAGVSRSWTLDKDNPSATQDFTIDHMASRNAILRPGSSLAGAGQQATITVSGPPPAAHARIYVLVVGTDGSHQRVNIASADGTLEATVADFDPDRVKRVSLTMANASTRFVHCSLKDPSPYSCGGGPVDDGEDFHVAVALQPQPQP